MGKEKSELKLIDTVRMTEWKSWFHIYKEDNKYHLYVFNQVWEWSMDYSSDTLEWIYERIEIIKPKK